MKNYFNKLQEVLKAQIVSYFLLLSFSTLFILKMATSAFFSHEGISIDWVTYLLIALLVFSFILQSLILQKKCYPLYLFRLLIVIFLIGQVGDRQFNKYAFHHEGGDSFAEPDSLLGFRLKPNQHNAEWWQVMGSSDTLYHIYYSIDNFSRRIPDDAFMKEDTMKQNHTNNHAVFLGCSFTFGVGLMYSSSFPYLFETLNPDYKSYNYGVPGQGPSHIALLLDKRANEVMNEDAIPEKDGFALYTYIDDHLNRVYGSLNVLSWTFPSYPNAYIENDSLVLKEWPKSKQIYLNYLRDIYLIKLLGSQLNYPQKESFYKRFASIINYMAKKYQELNPGNRFYIGIYPGYNKDLNWIKYLNKSIVVLQPDIPSDFESNRDKYRLNKYEYHPSEVFNVYYAKELTRLIEEYELKNKIN